VARDDESTEDEYAPLDDGRLILVGIEPGGGGDDDAVVNNVGIKG
jgi:hypothetical protein